MQSKGVFNGVINRERPYNQLHFIRMNLPGLENLQVQEKSVELQNHVFDSCSVMGITDMDKVIR